MTALPRHLAALESESIHIRRGRIGDAGSLENQKRQGYF